jgi:hypothetical protein
VDFNAKMSRTLKKDKIKMIIILIGTLTYMPGTVPIKSGYKDLFFSIILFSAGLIQSNNFPGT